MPAKGGVMSGLALDSPFIVPVAGIALGAVAVVGGIISDIKQKELRSQERIVMMNRGMSPAEIEAAMNTQAESRTGRDPLRSLGNARRAATVLISCGVGLVLFGLVLTWIVRARPVLVIAAVGLINIAIGVGFVIDYRMQKRELAHFGLEVDAESALGHRSGQSGSVV